MSIAYNAFKNYRQVMTYMMTTIKLCLQDIAKEEEENKVVCGYSCGDKA